MSLDLFVGNFFESRFHFAVDLDGSDEHVIWPSEQLKFAVVERLIDDVLRLRLCFERYTEYFI